MDWSELSSKIKFEELTDKSLPRELFPDFSVWNWGTGRFTSILGGMTKSFDKGSGQIAVVDYEYECSRNMRAPAAAGMQRGITLCFLKTSALNMPEIFQRNEAPIQKIFKRAVGKHEIFFSEDPEFSEHFEIQGPEMEVHRYYRPEVRSYFLRHFEFSPLRMEIMGDTILIHFGMLMQPEDSRILMIRILEIANFWAKRNIGLEIPPDIYFS